MTLYGDYFSALRCSGKASERIMADQLRGGTENFLKRGWIVPAGYLSSIWVPVRDLGLEDDIEVEIDDVKGVFTYKSPGYKSRTITRPLSDIAVYSYNPDAWLKSLIELFEIEPRKIASEHLLIEDHLWHLGDLRIGNTNHQAPLYLAMRLEHCSADWKRALEDRRREPRGIVLVDKFDDHIVVTNGHQVCWIESLLEQEHAKVFVKQRVLERLLGCDSSCSGGETDRFNETTGVLKLMHMERAKTFTGKQKSVIALFWRERYQTSVKWSYVMEQTGCGKDPYTVFGTATWTDWLVRVETGYYKMKIDPKK